MLLAAVLLEKPARIDLLATCVCADSSALMITVCRIMKCFTCSGVCWLLGCCMR